MSPFCILNRSCLVRERRNLRIGMDYIISYFDNHEELLGIREIRTQSYTGSIVVGFHPH